MAAQQKNAGKCLKEIQGYPERVQCLAQVDQTIWCGSAYGSIAVHDSQTLEPLTRFQAPGRGEDEDYVSSMLYVNGRVWCGGSDGVINVFDAQSGKCVAQLLGHSGSVTWLTLGTSLVWSASGDNSIRGWDAKNGKLVHVLTGHTNWVRTILAVGSKIWTGSDDCTIRVWDQETGNMGKVLEGHDGSVMALTLVDSTVWSGAADKSIRVWDAQTGIHQRDIRGHTGWVTSFAVRGTFVWSGSSDKTIRVWNSRNGHCVRVITGHTGWVWCLLSAGNNVWSGSGDKTVRVWTAESDVVNKMNTTPVKSPSPMRPPPRPRSASPEAFDIPPPPRISTSPIDRELSLGRVPAFEGDSINNLDMAELRDQLTQEVVAREEFKTAKEAAEKEVLLSKEAELQKQKLAEEGRRKSVRISNPEVTEKYGDSSEVASLRESLEQALITADSHSKARADLQKAKLRLQKELDDTKRELSLEKQLREDAENSNKMLHEQLNEIFALILDDDTFGSLREEDDSAIHQIESELGKIANIKRKIEQDRAAYRERVEQLETEKAHAEEEVDELQLKLRRLEAEMDNKIEETRRKIDTEIDRNTEIEGEAERLRFLQEKADRAQKDHERELSQLRKRLDLETEKVKKLEREHENDISKMERFRIDLELEKTRLYEEKSKAVDEKNKTLELMRSEQTKKQDAYSKRENELVALEEDLAEVEHERNTLHYDLKSATAQLEDESRDNTKLRNELERVNAEFDKLRDEINVNKLKIKEFEHQTTATHKTVETSKQTEEKLRAEIESNERSIRKYEDSLHEWRSILDSLRKADGSDTSVPLGHGGRNSPFRANSPFRSSSPIPTQPNSVHMLPLEQASEEFTKEIRGELKRIHEHYTSRPINEHDKRFRLLEDENRDLRWKVEGLEESKAELKDLLDRKYESGDQIISELFESKRDAQERLEDTKRKTRGETKMRMEMEEQIRWLQIELEKSKRAVEAEVRARNVLKVKLENEMKDWKERLEAELENGMRRLEEEDAAKAELEEDKRSLQAELLEEKRRSKITISDMKTKHDLTLEERMQLEAQVRAIELEREETRKVIQNMERARVEDRKVHEAELRDYKAMLEEELADTLKRLADEELKRVEIEEEKRSLINELETFRQSWKEESEDMHKRVEVEVKLRANLENAKKDLKLDVEETKKGLRAAEDLIHELREQNAALAVEIENVSRENVKIEEARKRLETKNRQISELENSISVIQRSYSEEEQVREKRIETLQAKLALETKQKDDLQQLKLRLEADLDAADRLADEDSQKRKKFEVENWNLRGEIEELRRKLIDDSDAYVKKLESEAQLRTVLQDANERLQTELANKFSNIDAEMRTRRDLEELNKKLLLQLMETKKTYEERVEALQQSSETETRRRALSDEARERLQVEMDQLRQQYEELRGEAEMEQSKMKFQKEIDVKKKTFEKRLGETRRRNSVSLENSVDLSSESSMMFGTDEDRKRPDSPANKYRSKQSFTDDKHSPLSKHSERNQNLESSSSPYNPPAAGYYTSSSRPLASQHSSTFSQRRARSRSPLNRFRAQDDLRSSLDTSIKMLEEEEEEYAHDAKQMESGLKINTTKKLESSFASNSDFEDIQKSNLEFHSTLDEFKKKLYSEKEGHNTSNELNSSTGILNASTRVPDSSKQMFQDLERSKKKLEKELIESRKKISGLLRGTSGL